MSKPFIARSFDQGTPEWAEFRAGKWSASKAAIIMGGLDTSGLDSYIKDLAWERVHGPTEAGFKSAAMERGNEVEPEARDWYAFERGVSVEQVGCVVHGDMPNVCWSPDGLVDGVGAIEAKCQLHKAWMDAKRTGLVAAPYRWQVRFAMWVGQLEWLDYVAYHPVAGGLIIPCVVTESEKDAMAERVTLLEKKVAKWVDILQEKAA